jgi:4'-phosphopantetheinyl transferase EntD
MTPLLFSDLQTRARGFLSHIAQEDSLIPGAVLVSASYAEAAFSDALFAQLDIPQPATLRRAIARRKAEFLAGRAMTQAAMACLGLPPRPVDTSPNRAPLWPSGLSGSISHARGRCACLLSQDTSRSFGIDTEAIAEGRSLSAILSQTLSPDEHALLTQGPYPPSINATVAFSAKEALFKALFPQVGHHFGFDAAELTNAPGHSSLTLALTTDLTETLPQGTRFDIHHRLSDTHVLTWLSVPNP